MCSHWNEASTTASLYTPITQGPGHAHAYPNSSTSDIYLNSFRALSLWGRLLVNRSAVRSKSNMRRLLAVPHIERNVVWSHGLAGYDVGWWIYSLPTHAQPISTYSPSILTISSISLRAQFKHPFAIQTSKRMGWLARSANYAHSFLSLYFVWLLFYFFHCY